MAAGIGLALTPLATDAARAQGQTQNTAVKGVSYDEAMSCSGLFSVLAGSAENEADEEQLIDLAAQWLMVAAARKGAGELPSIAEIQEVTAALNGVLDELESASERETVLFEALDACEARYNLIPEEFEN
ncbi:MAG: hypothetical protein EDM03_07075 [Porphyrobacter sp. IPPAS B-1204]|nr:MAG: hypothetical protein EDM03_07075 [Porphyrobacter sp. IPPAS B-1204]